MTLLAQTPSLRARQASLRTCARRAERAIKMQVSDCVDTALTRARQAARPLPGQGEGSGKAGRGKRQLADSWVCEFLFSAKIIGLRDSAKMTKVASPRARSGRHIVVSIVICETRRSGEFV